MNTVFWSLIPWTVTRHVSSFVKTVFNPTNHVYFNLTGDPTQPIDEHTLWLNSRLFATLNKDTTPTGEVVSVSGTAFDFQHPKKLGEVFASDFRQSTMVGGIDQILFHQGSSIPLHLADQPVFLIKMDDRYRLPSLIGENHWRIPHLIF